MNDFDIPKPLLTNLRIKKIIDFSEKNNIPIIEQKHNQLRIVDINNVVKKCEKKKKKKIKELSKQLNDYSKLPTLRIVDLKKTNDNILTEIEEIDDMLSEIFNEENINYINYNLNIVNNKNKEIDLMNEDYIDVFKN